MAELRFRTFRVKVYARLCPPEVMPEERAAFIQAVDRQDEEGLVEFLCRQPKSASRERVMKILQEARELGDRLNVLDRTLPSLPHPEVHQCYARLRELGDEVAGMEASGELR
jgi:hypothetical protein